VVPQAEIGLANKAIAKSPAAGYNSDLHGRLAQLVRASR
jgi:hypothetical protein